MVICDDKISAGHLSGHVLAWSTTHHASCRPVSYVNIRIKGDDGFVASVDTEAAGQVKTNGLVDEIKISLSSFLECGEPLVWASAFEEIARVLREHYRKASVELINMAYAESPEEQIGSADGL